MPVAKQNSGFGYEGIPSFCRLPMCFDLNELDADIAIAGLCIDTGTSNRSGTRYGPRAIREASMLYSMGYYGKAGFYDIDLKKQILSNKQIVDCGDISTLPTLTAETFDIATEFVRGIRSKGAVPVILGGDHSISYPLVRAFNDIPLHVVQFDTHLDLADDIEGIKLGHANPMKRIADLENVTGLTHIGIRGLLNPPDWVDNAEKGKSTYFTADEVYEKGTETIVDQIPKSENLYITLDIDSLDPSVAPGTGTPEPGGLTYRQLRSMLRGCVRNRKLVGMDLVEVNPLYDQSGRTAQVAARLIIDLLGAAFM